jgi:8-oxo-dGTP pyrophosphatase MutT (NUDIX family)
MIQALHHPLLADWPVLREARRHDASLRLPFDVLDHDVRKHVGSVAIAHLPALPVDGDTFVIDAQGLLLKTAPSRRSELFADLNLRLHQAGLVRGWRHEIFGLWHRSGEPPLALIERASARFWGCLTLGAHCNGLAVGAVGDGDGAGGRGDDASNLWLGRRSTSKSTDPGMLDNLIGGGVPADQTPLQALHREGFEEAGLSPAQMQAARPTGVYRIVRDIPEGLQNEDIHVHEIELPAAVMPINQDGEVAEFRRVDMATALRHVQAGELTVDASIATLDCAMRRGWLAPLYGQATADAMAGALAELQSSRASRADWCGTGDID